MLLSIAYAIQSHRENKERERQRNADRKARDEYRAERAVWESERNSLRAEQQRLIELLKAEQARGAELTARVMELSEIIISRANGRDANRDGENNRGE